jgi:hypothetical protein
VVPPKLTHVLNKNPCCDATGRKSQRHFFQVRRTAYSVRLYPCSITGAPELGYLRFTRSPVQLGGPFGFCAFALLSDCGHSRPRARLSGNRFEAYSSSSAFLYCVERDCMTEGGGCQEGESGRGKSFMNSLLWSWVELEQASRSPSLIVAEVNAHYGLGRFLIVQVMLSRYHIFSNS